jgi:hypothetical protein
MEVAAKVIMKNIMKEIMRVAMMMMSMMTFRDKMITMSNTKSRREAKNLIKSEMILNQ